MAKNDQEEAFEKILTSTLSRTIEFVRFAEAKHAGLLTFCSAWILASVNLLSASTGASGYWKLALQCAIPLFALSAIISMSSFLPRISLKKILKEADPEKLRSLIFFGDIAEFDPKKYRERLKERYFPDHDNSVTEAYLDDLSEQIAANSKIAQHKFRQFILSARIAFLAIGALMMPGIYSIILVFKNFFIKAAFL